MTNLLAFMLLSSACSSSDEDSAAGQAGAADVAVGDGITADVAQEYDIAGPDAGNSTDPTLHAISFKFNGTVVGYEKTIMTDAFYYSSGDHTAIGNGIFELVYPGSMAGTASTGDGVTVNLTHEGEEWYNDQGAGSEGDFSITITSYGAVGEAIEGTFSGTVLGLQGGTAEITDGQFSIIRSEDG